MAFSYWPFSRYDLFDWRWRSASSGYAVYGIGHQRIEGFWVVRSSPRVGRFDAGNGRAGRSLRLEVWEFQEIREIFFRGRSWRYGGLRGER